MECPNIRISPPVAVLIFIFSVVSAPLLLFVGVAELIHPDVPEAYLFQNAVVCLTAIVLGVALPFVAVSVYLGSIRTRRSARARNQGLAPT